ncbi:MAG: ribosome biogenesis GTPase Der [Candidatus Nomurabacteria bacterium]|nr:MAG: ribosome biogenesis GTPase Der [Candidatus Nomurabacteria bacterium]
MAQQINVTIIGRTNVGKSRLFNRLTESRGAIVAPESGTTRDMNAKEIEWRDTRFNLIDTGGWTINEDDEISTAIRKRTERAVREAKLLLFVVDGRADLTHEDLQFAAWIRKQKKPCLLVVNKIESTPAERRIPTEIHRLGLGSAYAVSAANGRGSGDLLDVIVEKLGGASAQTKDPGLRIAFIGRPNVGKSSLMNAILNDDRVLVSPQPFTTRDAISVPFTWKEKKFTLVDTAGLRRRVRVPRKSLEAEGADISRQTMHAVDVLVLVLDLSERISAQDRTLIVEAMKAVPAMVIAANKWDLVTEKDATTLFTMEKDIRSHLSFVHWAPIVFVSAFEKTRVANLLEKAQSAWHNAQRKLSDNELEAFRDQLIRRHPPTKGKGARRPRIRVITQIRTAPPHFDITIGPKEDLHPNYLAFVERMLRERYDFEGSAIHLSIRKPKINR